MIIFDAIFGLFTELWFIILLSGIIILWLLYAMLRVGEITGPIIQMLKDLEESVNEHNSNSGKFWDGWNIIKEEIDESNYLGHAWKKYTESLIFDEENKVIKYTARPATYLNIEAVDSKGDIEAMQASSNYFVGWGLVFTFIGLLAALYFAADGFKNNQEDLTGALEDLLGAATFKFATSITGLVSSILLSLYYRGRVKELQHRLGRLCRALEKGMVFTTREHLANDELKELKQQSEQIKQLGGGFASSLGEVLQKKMDKSLGAALEKITKEISRWSDNIGKMSQDAMSKLVKEFIKELHDATGKEMLAISKIIQESADSLKAAADNIGNAGGDFSTQLKTTLEEAMARIQELIDQMTDGSSTAFEDRFAGVDKTLGSFVKKLDSASDSQQKYMMDFAEKINQEMNKSINLLSGGIGQLEGAIETFGKRLEDQEVFGTSQAESSPNRRDDVVDQSGRAERDGNEISENKNLS